MAPDEALGSTRHAVASDGVVRTSRKRLTIYVGNIPPEDAATSKLAANLRRIIAKDPILHNGVANITIHSTVPRSDSKYCATVSLDSSFRETDLCETLQRNRMSFRYSFTRGFNGITPVHVDQDGAQVEYVLAPSSPREAADLSSILAVPGLASHGLGSWKTPSSDDVWLRDFLPENVKKIRVLLYGYDSKLQGSQSRKSIHDMSLSLLQQIKTYRSRDETLKRPIILIGHSLGGLLIKKALVIAHQKGGHDESIHAFYEACCGVLFFGVPHLGLHNEALRTPVMGQPTQVLVDDILIDKDLEPPGILRSLAEDFAACCKDRFKVVSFYETVLSPTVELDDSGNLKKTGKCCLLVTKDSATRVGLTVMLGEDEIPIDTDHSGLVKFADSDDPHYDTVADRIGNLVEKAVSEVQEQPVTPDLSHKHDATNDCMRSLAFEGMDFRRNDIAEAEAGTFEWFTTHETFRRWIDQPRGLLWIKGKPGAGKSTLMKFAKLRIQEMISRDTIVVGFFFHGRGAELQKTPFGLFRSFLHQLLGKVPGALVDLVEFFVKQRQIVGEHDDKWEWHEKQLQAFLRDALATILISKPVVIFVDALDECGQMPAVELIDYIKRLLKDLPATQHSFRVLFSCRYYPNLCHDSDGTGLTIDLGKENQADIEKYVRNRLSVYSYDSNIRQLISSRVKSNGVFLWARLAVDRVCLMTLNAESPRAIEAKIRNIPGDLTNLYRGLLEGLMEKMPDHTQTALRLMLWVCFAQHPLTLEEIQWAIAIAPDCAFESLDEYRKSTDFIEQDRLSERISTLSCGLLEVVKYIPNYYATREPKVQFIHQSVRDFLLESGLMSLGASVPIIPVANYQLGLACLQYIRLFGPNFDTSDRDPELGYAAEYWATHVRLGHSDEESFEEVINLIRPNASLLTSLWLIRRAGSRLDIHKEGEPFVHLAAEESLVRLLSWMLSNAGTSEAVVEDQNSAGETAIHTAACHGNDSIMDLIIKSGKADLNVKDNSGRTPLIQAARHGSYGCVNLLLKSGEVDVDAKDNSGRTPLFHAASRRSSDCVDLLLRTGEVDVGVKDNAGWTPLIYAASCRSSDCVDLLLRTGEVDVDVKDNAGWTPLIHAVSRRSSDCVDILLRTGEADVNIITNSGHTALLLAAKGYKDHTGFCVNQLLKTGKVDDLDLRDKRGRTTLSYAAASQKTCSESNVRLLLESGRVDVDSKDNEGRTPLSYAAAYNAEPIAQLLLKTKKVEIDSTDNNGRTPLSYAAKSEGTEVVKLLIDTDRVDIDSRDNNGRTPLSYAAAYRASTVELLIKTGNTDIDSKDNKSRTPLSYAAGSDNVSVVQLLIDTGRVDVDSKDKDGRTPLFYATLHACGPDLQPILEAGKVKAKTDELDDGDSLALLSQPSYGRVSAIRLLLETGTVDVHSEDNYGFTPFGCAARRLRDETEK